MNERAENKKNKKNHELLKISTKHDAKSKKEMQLAKIEFEKEKLKVDLQQAQWDHELKIEENKTRQAEIKYMREKSISEDIHNNIQNIKDYHKKG